MKLGVGLLAVGLVIGCSSPDKAAGSDQASVPKVAKDLVVFSQANSQDPWRKVFDAETKDAAASLASSMEFDMQDAGGDASKQNDIINTFLVRNPKVLLVSPTETSVASSIEKAFDSGVKVILLDRAIEGEKYTALIAGDNVEIGRQAGEYVAKRLGGKGTVLMISGIAQATPTKDRASGFMEVMKKNPGITIINGDDCGYQRQKARSYMETFLLKGQKIDCVYAHNDEMAIGARLAWDAANPNGGAAPIFVGIDACQQEVVDMIKAGKLDATFKYPTPGRAGVELAAKLLKGESVGEKKMILPTEIVTKDNADAYLASNKNLAK